ncbi:ceramidase domain-containing protein [Alkalinema pantanalense CENA528]|uniref:ceramidase domain-containing protein n=1 Tax=Alkalinema pantanalense TaxID=1620705 RepID=UPI003D6DB8EE
MISLGDSTIALSLPQLLTVLCPWHQFQHPAPQFCEAHVCAWIMEPANAWSSLAYSLVGIGLCVRHPDKANPDQSKGFVEILGPIGILLGLASFAYHAAYTPSAQFLDLLSMFLLSNWVLVLNCTRSGMIPIHGIPWMWLGGVLGSTLFLGISLQWGRTIFGLELAATIVAEIYLYLKGKTASYQDFWIIITLFAAAFLMWSFDLYRITCNPDLHWLQGHAIWHILTAVCLVFIDRFYRQIFSSSSSGLLGKGSVASLPELRNPEAHR